MTVKIECQTCAYWSSSSRDQTARHSSDAAPQLGQCRRHAPTLQRSDQGLRGMWPTTHAMQWCGEHGSVQHEGSV